MICSDNLQKAYNKYVLMSLFKKLFLLLSFSFLLIAQTNQAQAQTASVRLGGMNLYGYCQSLNQGGSTLNGNTWQCESGQTINLDAACRWQYNNPTSVSRQEAANNPYTWACYTAGSTPTPTISPTQPPPPTPVVATPTRAVTPTPSAGTLVIFDDALATGWTDASYRATNSIVTTQAGVGTRSISSTLQADGGFNVQSISGIQTNANTVLHFMLRASVANQRYEVYVDSQYGQPLREPVSLANYGGQPTTTAWRTYDIPLSDLGGANISLRDIAIHDASGSNQQAVFIDQVELRSITVSTSPTVVPTATPVVSVTPTPTRTVTPTPTTTPQAGATVTVFADALANGWTDASYSTTNNIVTNPVGSGTNAIAATINRDGGFDLQSVNGLLTSNNSILHFMLRASTANQQYEVYADTVYGQPLREPVSLANYGGQPTTTAWRTYDIPLSDLGATNVSLRDIVLHDAAGANQGIVYIDQIELRSVASAATPTVAPTIRATATPTPTPTATPNTGVRRSIYSLTPQEVTRLTNAFNTIRANGVYQDFMNRHMQSMMTLTQPNDPTTLRNVAHRGPSFLPWHRSITREFELALQSADPSVTLPYWPFEQETPGQLPRVFSAAYFGGDGNPAFGNRVIDGPFASWQITRMVGRDPEGQATAPTQANVNALMQYTNYDSAPYNETSSGFRNGIEGWIGPNGQWSMHNRIHAYVGGDMLPRDDMSTNVVNDPIFWLVHANIDRIWWQWQQTRGITNYQPASGGPTGHNLNDRMQFLNSNTTPASNLDIRTMGYSYQ